MDLIGSRSFAKRIPGNTQYRITIGVCQVPAVRIDLKGSGPCIENISVRILYLEKAFSGNSHIQTSVSGLKCGTAHVQVDASQLGTITDLGSIGSSHGCTSARSVLECLVKHIRKTSAAGFKTKCINIGNIIADNIKLALVCLHTGHRRI